MIRLSFQGIQHRRVLPNTEEPSPSRFAVNHVSGLFCNASAKYAQELRPSRPQGVSPIFRASLVQTSAALRPFHSRCRFVSRVGDTPRLRQVAFGMYVTCHCQKNGGQKQMSNPTPNPFRIRLSDMLKQQGRSFEEM